MTGLDSYIFRTVVRLLFFFINILAIHLLLRGHNLPGGGFIAGLATAISLVLLSMGIGLREMHRVLSVDPVRIACTGLLIAFLTALAPMIFGYSFLRHFHWHFPQVPFFGELHLGTPLLFDIGVYLVVVGITTKIIFILSKSTEGLRVLVEEEESRYSSVLDTPIEQEHHQDRPKKGDHAN